MDCETIRQEVCFSVLQQCLEESLPQQGPSSGSSSGTYSSELNYGLVQALLVDERPDINIQRFLMLCRHAGCIARLARCLRPLEHGGCACRTSFVAPLPELAMLQPQQ